MDTQRAFNTHIPINDKVNSYIWQTFHDKNHHLSTYPFYVRLVLLYINAINHQGELRGKVASEDMYGRIS